MPSEIQLRQELKELIIDRLRLDGLTADRIGDDTPLFGQGLGLDSVDALELIVGIEQLYRISIKSHEVGKEVFTSVGSLAQFVSTALAGGNRGRALDGA